MCMEKVVHSKEGHTLTAGDVTCANIQERCPYNDIQEKKKNPRLFLKSI